MVFSRKISLFIELYLKKEIREEWE